MFENQDTLCGPRSTKELGLLHSVDSTDVPICLGITVYGPRIFEIAGIAPKDQVNIAKPQFSSFSIQIRSSEL